MADSLVLIPSPVLADCHVVEQTAARLVARIPDLDRRQEVALWCLRNDLRIVNPFAHVDDPHLVMESSGRRIVVVEAR